MTWIKNIFVWAENLWNLKNIFDKYLPKLRDTIETLKRLQADIANLKEEVEKAKEGAAESDEKW